MMDSHDFDKLLETIPPFPTFGAALRYFRTTMADRLRRLTPGIGGIQMTNQAVVGCLTASGYDISPSTYSELENSRSLPRDPDQFLEKLCPCLAIERNTLPYWLLVQHLSYDLVRQRVGDDIAGSVVVIDRKELVERLLAKDKLRLD